MLSAHDDNELVFRCLQGDKTAFNQIVEKYQQRIFNIAYRMTNNHEDALDLAQESFLRIYRALASYKGESAFSTWIHRIASNVCLDELRKKKRQPLIGLSTDATVSGEEGEYSIEFAAGDEDTPEHQLMRREVRREIALALSQVTPEHRIVLVLRDIEGYSYEEMAEIIGVNVGTIKSRLNRARIALREVLRNAEHLPQQSRLSVQKGG